ncbi:RNA polymerase sigma factor [Bacillus sp. FJAT-49736]|uniref:RNA polymerase sigma factor n=1 Tax=Bacillus sp. FJAT-49736 TaxID=2833582 RepID=UPI001BC9DD8D|nr:RNA polymerase sigma factor [Bacillus sp. FJAT-49736]MBS4172691.1 RNA polymerase sigma factor [Bacillus sp. FJAT-49736]
MEQFNYQRAETSIENLEEFKQHYVAYKKHVFAMALSILRDFELSEDVLQDVYMKLFQYMKHQKIKNVKAWLISVSRNRALDLYRKKKREITGFEHEYFEKSQYMADDPVDKLVLSKYLSLLDTEERQIVILKEISGMKHREIASIMEMPLGTVLWKYRVALKKLKNALE